MINTLSLAQSLEQKYRPQNTDNTLNAQRYDFLSECIIPSETFVYSGRGATLQTSDGELIDLASMTVNCILGQNDPWVNANMIAYLLSGRPSFLTTRLGSDFYYKVARRIIDATKMKDAVINHRQCNGTDVTELAILAAYNHRKEGQHLLASFNNSYHGQGLVAYMMSGLQRRHRYLINEDPVIFFNQPTNTFDLDSNEKLSSQDAQTLAEFDTQGSNIFGVIIEPIQINNAVNTPTKAFMKKLQSLCKKYDIPLIYDEVQTGFGWLGTMTAAERYGVWPNLMALSKALTSGNGPFSALVSDKKYQDIVDGTGAKTNGSDIRSLIASNAVMDRLMGIPEDQIPQDIPDQLAKELKHGLLANFESQAELLEKNLEEIKQASKGLIRSIKGYGLVRGLEIVDTKGNFDSKKTKELQAKLLANGVLVRHHGHTLIVKPPIVLTDAEREKGFDKIKKILSKNI